MAVVGTVALQLTANTAQFHQEMGKANKALGETSKNFGGAQRAASNFAAKGIAEAIPALQGFEHQIGNLLTKVANAQGLLGGLGATALLAGGFLGGIRLGNLISDFIDLGMSLEDYEKKLKAAHEEQEKFLAQRVKVADLGRQLRAELAQSTANLAQTAAELGGDLFGAASAKRQAEIADISAKEDEKRRQIIATAKTQEDRDAFLTISKQTALNARFAADSRYWAAVDKLSADSLAKSTADFAKANDAALDALQKRQAIRKEIEARATEVVTSGQIRDPGAQADALKKQFTERAEAFAVLIQKGRTWNDLEDQIFATEQFMQAQGLPGFRGAIIDAGKAMEKAGTDADSLTKAMDNWKKGLNELPASVDRADPAIQALISRFGEIQRAGYDAAAAIQFLNSVITTRAAPPALQTTAPVDLGGGGIGGL